MKFISYSLMFVLLLVFVACDGGEEVKTSKRLIPAKFDSPNNNTSFRIGQDLTINVGILELESIEKIRVFTKDTTIFEGKPDKTNLSFNIHIKNWKVGSLQISLETTLKDGQVRKDNRIIKILPDTFPIEYTAEAIKVYPHDITSYTQGLEFDGDQLYESTGSVNAERTSIIAKVDLETGKIEHKKDLESKYFGEGITIFGDDLYQLTWKEFTCFVYDKHTLELKNTFTYTGEGWGLCNDGEYLISTDGSERIYFRDPATFGVKKTIEVYSNQGPIKGLNELEYINGKIYANVYTTDQIVIIDPETGVVTGRIDASLLALDYRKGGEVLNGIAYKESTKQLFITGKNWPNLIEIGLVEE